MSVCQPYVDKGHYVFMANYYTIVALFDEIGERKIISCGCVQSNGIGFPKEIRDLKEEAVKVPKREQSLYKQKGNLTCVTWRDRNLINQFCSYCSNQQNTFKT